MHILHMNKERVFASGVSFFAPATLIAWTPMTGPSCLHTTTDIGHGSPASYHNLRPEIQPITLASGMGSFQYRPTPAGQEEVATVWMTLEQQTRLERIHGARRRWLTGRHQLIL
jgi:hypothetical protein